MKRYLHCRTGSLVACADCAIVDRADAAAKFPLAMRRAVCIGETMRCVLLASLGLMVAGCSLSKDPDFGASGGAGGGFGATGGGTTSAGTGGGGKGDPTLGGGGTPEGTGGTDVQDCGLPTSLIELSPEQPRDWAAGQFSLAMLEGGWLPPAESLSVPQVRDCLQDLVNVGASPDQERVSFSLVSGPKPEVFQLKGRALGRTTSGIKSNIIVLLDVSPSTSTIAEGRDAVLNALADGVDARDNFTFSLLSFSGSSELIVDRVVSGEARSALELQRTRLAYVEGGDLPGALRSAQELLNTKDGPSFSSSHVLILTDGGLVPSEATLGQVEQLIAAAEDVHVSVAQLSTVPLHTAPTPTVAPTVAPTELHRELLSEIARRGRGMSFFFPGTCGGCLTSELVEASFGRWFAPFEDAPNFEFSLPGGLSYLPDPTEDPGDGTSVSAQPGVSFERSLRVQNECGASLNNVQLEVSFGDASRTGTIVADMSGALTLVEGAARVRADERLKAAIEAMREPGDDYCSQLSNKLTSAGDELPCSATDFDCRYVALVEDFVAKAQGLCLN